MPRHLLSSLSALGFLGLALAFNPVEAQTVPIEDPENTLIVEVGLGYDSDAGGQPANTGTIVIELLDDAAPQHAERLKQLARDGFYDGVVFHRVIEGFMAQTGDPTGTGAGGSDYPDLPAEFSNVPFDRGMVGMARASSPNSANSQFFIMFDEGHFLNGQYTVVGRVLEGMDVVDRIKRGPRDANGVVDGARDRMLSVKVAADG